MLEAINRLLSSRKALMMLAAVIAATTLASLGKVTGTEALEFVKWVVLVWIGAQAAVDAVTRRPIPPRAEKST
jgi:hypothetical protein